MRYKQEGRSHQFIGKALRVEINPAHGKYNKVINHESPSAQVREAFLFLAPSAYSTNNFT